MKGVLYSSPLRPLYEWDAARLWVIVSLLTLIGGVIAGASLLPVLLLSASSGWMAYSRRSQILNALRLQRGLAGPPVGRMSTAELRKKMTDNPGMVWLGWGFPWRQHHAQLNHELLTEQFKHLAPLTSSLSTGTSSTKGAGFVHGIGMPEERDMMIPLAHQAGHTLVVGTTGAGKTRLLDILATQCIFRDEACVVFDPKGDRDLAESLERSCRNSGHPDRFVYFHPAHPSRSALINPLRNFNRESELASRVAALVPSESGGDVFKAFAWMAMNKVITGLLATEVSPDLVSLRRLLEMGPDRLLKAVLERHFDKVAPDWRAKITGKVDHEMKAYSRFYRNLSDDLQDSEVDGLLNMVEHDREHFGKMVASLIPVLTMLTSGPMMELLSPSRAGVGDTRVRTDMRTIIKEKKVLYVALDSLSDAVVGSAIGSMLLSDLTSVAGDLYNKSDTNKAPVNVFIDEAAEVMNDPTIQLLNKGRGAGMRLTVLTQTFADLESRLGSAAKARMVLGNLNNQVILRTLDGNSQKYLAENMPETVIYGIERSQSNSSGTAEPSAFSGSFSERTSETTIPLISAQVMGLIPDLHYFAKVGGSLFMKVRLPLLFDEGAGSHA